MRVVAFAGIRVPQSVVLSLNMDSVVDGTEDVSSL